MTVALAPATVTLAAGELEAAFDPARGMLGTSLRHAGAELLDEAGGLPLLYPWANRLGGDRYEVGGRAIVLPSGSPLVPREEHGLPIHGLRTHSWRVQAGPSRLRATLDLGEDPELLALFPFPHVVTLDVRLTPSALTVATTLRATGGVPVPVSFGFHPYLRLPGVPRERWRIGLPAARWLTTDARGIPTGEGRQRPARRFALGDLAFDDGFAGVAPGAALELSGGGRSIAVRLVRGYPVAQIFTPPGAEFVCLEPMTAPTDALRTHSGLGRVAPGDAFTAVFAIEVAYSSPSSRARTTA